MTIFRIPSIQLEKVCDINEKKFLEEWICIDKYNKYSGTEFSSRCDFLAYSNLKIWNILRVVAIKKVYYGERVRFIQSKVKTFIVWLIILQVNVNPLIIFTEVTCKYESTILFLTIFICSH